jgi:hypothetical protein
MLPAGAPAAKRQLGSGGQGNAQGNAQGRATGTNRDELLAEIEELDQEK